MAYFLFNIINHVDNFFIDTECSRPKISRDSQQSPTKSLNSPSAASAISANSPEPPCSATSSLSLKKHSPPNVTVIHPSANHPMFSYLCHATGNMAAVAAGYMSQPNYPAGLLPPMELNHNAAAAASLMNPFLFSQLLRQGFPPMGAAPGLEGGPPGPFSRSPVSLPHRFSPYGPMSMGSALPPVSSTASLMSRNSVAAAAGDELKNLLSTLSRIKGEV